MKKYDLAVIGAGAGGLTAAFTGVGFSKKVVLIDKNKPGGECTWSGCVPSKGLINIAKEVHHAKKYTPHLKVDTSQVLNEVRSVIETVYEGETPEKLQDAGIDYINGYAKFLNKKTIEVNGEKIRAKKFIIATGSSPMVPPIPGLEQVPYLTNETIFEQPSFSDEMIILGGGAIGVELSQALNRLGIKVTLVEMANRILPRDEEELVLLAQQRLREEGVDIRTATKAVEVREEGNAIRLTVEKNGKQEKIFGDQLVLALGRKANVDNLGLDDAKVKFSAKGVQVDSHLESTGKGIYAVGDVAGPYQFSHMANAQGILAVQNALLPVNKKMSYEHVTWATYMDPELARSGLTEAEAREKYGDSIRVYRHSFEELDRAMTKQDTIGMVKIILDKKGFVLGASIFGESAGEIVSQIQTIKTLQINFGKLAQVIHPYPTYSEVLIKIAKKVYVENLLNQPAVKLVNKIRK